MSELAIQRYLSNSEAHCFVPAWGADAPKESRLTLETENYWVSLAQSHDEVREAQQLRYQVFSEEYGAVFLGPEKGLDQDQFDGYCDHIVVRNRQSARVVGTYRILLPAQARRAGGLLQPARVLLNKIRASNRRPGGARPILCAPRSSLRRRNYAAVEGNRSVYAPASLSTSDRLCQREYA